MPAAVIVTAQADAWTTDRYPTRNYGDDSVMRVHSTPLKRAFVRFEVAEGGVRRATLRVFAPSAAPTGFEVYVTSGGWTEAGITHGRRPRPARSSRRSSPSRRRARGVRST